MKLVGAILIQEDKYQRGSDCNTEANTSLAVDRREHEFIRKLSHYSEPIPFEAYPSESGITIRNLLEIFHITSKAKDVSQHGKYTILWEWRNDEFHSARNSSPILSISFLFYELSL